jgi:hypothetical protein
MLPVQGFFVNGSVVDLIQGIHFGLVWHVVFSRRCYI